MNNSFIFAENIERSFIVGATYIDVLKGISLKIDKNDFISIMGPSGAGKSTFLNILGLLDSPSKGRVFIEDVDTNTLNQKERAKIRSSKIGFVFQFYHLLPELNALENVLLPAMVKSSILNWSINKKRVKEEAISLLKSMGLGDRIKHKPNQLSGGEQQRVAIARALINNPEILLCDEPTGNLDTTSSNEILNMLDDLNKNFSKTIVLVTHNPEIAKRAKKQIFIVDGKIVDYEYGQTG